MPIDELDLATVHILNSPDLRAWPITATITRLDFRSTGVHVDHTKRNGAGAWPNFRPPAWDGDLQYSLWIFLHIGGSWHGSGCIQFWQSCDQNGGPPEEFAKNWYYAADRWAPMTGHQPTPGERVGFMVSAGDARNNGTQTVQERSNIVAIPFPRSGESYTPPTTPDPIPEPTPTPDPAPPVQPSLTPVLLDASQFDVFIARFDSIDRQLASLRSDLKQAGADFVKSLPAFPKNPLTWR